MDTEINISTSSSSQSLLNSKLDELSSYKSMGISSEKKDMSSEERVKYAKAARGFESMFVNLMLKEMKAGMLDETEKDGDTGFGADTLMGYADMMFSDQVSKTGSGIGIAEMIYEQLTGEKLSPITVQNVQSDDIISNRSAKTATSANDIIKSTFDELQQLSSSSSSIMNNSASNSSTANSFIDRVNNRLAKYESTIAEASSKFGVPTALIKSVIAAESAGQSNATSSVGAKGLMQLMDGTAKDLGVSNSYDATQNIMGGTKYLKSLLSRFGNIDNAIAAYNAGPGNVEKYNGVPPFKETQNYVRKVKSYLTDYFS